MSFWEVQVPSYQKENKGEDNREGSVGKGWFSGGLQKARAGCEMKESQDKLDSAFLPPISESPPFLEATLYCPQHLSPWLQTPLLTNSPRLKAFSGNFPKLRRATLPEVMLHFQGRPSFNDLSVWIYKYLPPLLPTQNNFEKSHLKHPQGVD